MYNHQCIATVVIAVCADCRTSVYYSSHFMRNSEKYVKINRHEGSQEQLKIFDYSNDFYSSVTHFVQEARSRGDTGAVLLFFRSVQ